MINPCRQVMKEIGGSNLTIFNLIYSFLLQVAINFKYLMKNNNCLIQGRVSN